MQLHDVWKHHVETGPWYPGMLAGCECEGNPMSIETIIAGTSFKELLAIAAETYGKMGLVDATFRHCMDITVRYCLYHRGSGMENIAAGLFNAIAHIATRQVHVAALGEPSRRLHSHVNVKATDGWIDKVCVACGIDAWLDDSLERWYIDSYHPFHGYFMQACYDTIMPYITTKAVDGGSIDTDEIVDRIVSRLQGKFPAISRFKKHAREVFLHSIEEEITGMPLLNLTHYTGIPATLASDIGQLHAVGRVPTHDALFNPADQALLAPR